MRCGRVAITAKLGPFRKVTRVSGNFDILLTKPDFLYIICNSVLLHGIPSYPTHPKKEPCLLTLRCTNFWILFGHQSSMAFMRAAHDASHKSHALYGTISVGCTKKSFLKQLRGKTKEETLLKQTQNFSCTQKHFFFLNRQVLDQEKNVIGNHMNRRSLTVCVCVGVAPGWLPCTRCALAPTRVFFCIALEQEECKGPKKGYRRIDAPPSFKVVLKFRWRFVRCLVALSGG